MNRKEALYFREKFEFVPKKRLGQNFLVDRNNIDKIIHACNLSRQDTVLEIGPGLGALTFELAGRVGKLIAVELDSNLFNKLKQDLKSYNNISFKCQDIQDFKFTGYKNLKIIGNLPFYIASSIVIKLLEHKKAIKSIFITVQKELAQRMLASCGDKDYGSFSLFVQYHCQPEALFNIKRTCFRPQPKVDAAFLNLIIRKKNEFKVKDEVFLFKIIRKSFSQRRKNILNALRDLIPKERLLPILTRNNISPDARAENLALNDFIHLANTSA